jgi:nucleotide-binding universal stress UspA family protein
MTNTALLVPAAGVTPGPLGDAAVLPDDLDPAGLRTRVVVGMDDSPGALAALRHAVTEAAYRGGEVLALHVWQYPTSWGFSGAWAGDYNPGAYLADELAKTIADLQAQRRAAGEPAVRIVTRVEEGFSAAALIAAATGAALLVMGARHHNRLLGSVSQSCINHAPCPIVLVPSPEPTNSPEPTDSPE